jgi:uncharacterized protein YkwD
MNWVDVGLVVFILIGVYAGWHRGFIHGILDIATLVLSFLLAFLLYQSFGNWFHQIFHWSVIWARPVAFAIVFFIVMLVLGWSAHFLSSKITLQRNHPRVNQWLGLIPGAVDGAAMAALVAIILITMPFPAIIANRIHDSWLTNNLATQFVRLSRPFNLVFSDAISQALTHITVPAEPEKTTDLHFTVQDPVVRPDLEAAMVVMLNKERISKGIRPLEVDSALIAVARQHSIDMFQRGYFGHITPDGNGPFDRLLQAHIDFLIAGENIALGPTLILAHEGLMNSPGHRANILDPQYGRIGIGIVDGGKYGIMITQLFKD